MSLIQLPEGLSVRTTSSNGGPLNEVISDRSSTFKRHITLTHPDIRDEHNIVIIIVDVVVVNLQVDVLDVTVAERK